MAVAARLRLAEKRITSNDGVEVTLNPVYSNDPSNPNYTFSKYTPSGSVKLFITNPDAYGYFEFGKEYDATFTEKASE